jgi:hypothetical protein
LSDKTIGVRDVDAIMRDSRIGAIAEKLVYAVFAVREEIRTAKIARTGQISAVSDRIQLERWILEETFAWID